MNESIPPPISLTNTKDWYACVEALPESKFMFDDERFPLELSELPDDKVATESLEVDFESVNSALASLLNDFE